MLMTHSCDRAPRGALSLHPMQRTLKSARFHPPGILNIPIDTMAQKIVKALEVRDWKCSNLKDLKVEFNLMRTATEIVWRIKKIRTSDFCLKFDCIENDSKNYFTSVVVIPRKKLLLTKQDDVGRRTYSQNVWKCCKNEIMDSDWESYEKGYVNDWELADWLKENVLDAIQANHVKESGEVALEDQPYPKELGALNVAIDKHTYLSKREA